MNASNYNNVDVMMMILFLSLTWYMLWKKDVKNDAHDTKNDKSITYMA